MVGRDGELARVTRLLDDALAGRGRLVLCTGEAGIGKTRLGEELTAAAAVGGVLVAWARAADRGSSPPYGLWRLVLVLDDLQWADEASAVLLTDLVLQLRGTRILVFASYRASPGPGDETLLRLSAEANAERVDLHGLAAEAIGDLLAGLRAARVWRARG